jgi:glucosamine 6-phosphate synthetase-like amidotransferase/phosphosugar isomerase protein
MESIDDLFLKNVRNISITGCGDSYSAGVAALPAFIKYMGAFAAEFKVERAIDAARYMKFDRQYPSDNLLIGVSASGGPARIYESLKRANVNGYKTLALTNNPVSRVAEEANESLIVNTPAFSNPNPGLRNYYASILGLIMLAAKIGEVKGISQKGSLERLTSAVQEYTYRFEPVLGYIDEQMFELAKAWKDFSGFNFMGDANQFASARFGAAKVIEVSGIISSVDDTENWCHVGTYSRNPKNIGTIVFADKNANNKSRICETIQQASIINRPVLLVTNGIGRDFHVPSGVKVCTLPDTPKGYDHISTLMNYVPVSILAGYISDLLSEPYFRGNGIWTEDGVGTIKTSEIEII